MRKSLFLILVFYVSLVKVQAQVSADGSVYSRYGLGEKFTFVTSQAQAMGGAGIAVNTPLYVSASNPANLGNQVLTRFVGSYRYNANQLKDAIGNKSTLASANVETLQFSFPIVDRRVGFGVSFQPYTKLGYRIQSTSKLPANLNEPETSYLVSYEGNGSIQQFDVGMGVRIGSASSVGAGLRVYTGLLENSQNTELYGPTDRVFEPRLITENTRLYGLAPNIGFNLVKDKLNNKEDRWLGLGASLSLGTDLTTRRARVLGEDSIVDTLSVSSNGTTTIPMTAIVGLAYRHSNKVLAALDLQYEPWSKFQSDFAFGGYDPNVATDKQYQNRVRVGGGVEYIPAGANFRDRYLMRAAYRAGFYVDQAFYQVANKVYPKTYALTAGIGLPTRKFGSSVDWNFEVGVRGNTDTALIRDLFFKTGFTLNFGEKWFNRFKLQ